MLSLKRFVAVGASEEAILFSKLWLDANYFKQTRGNLDFSYSIVVLLFHLLSLVAAIWLAEGARCSLK